MTPEKSRSITELEKRMEGLEPGSLRYQLLDCARRFKSSWIDLGRFLFTVYKDKHYKEWGYLTFEAYTAKEIGVRNNTALKLLKSYMFLEREEPAYLKERSFEAGEPARIPSYEAVNSLRLAKSNERIPENAYEDLRDAVLEDAQEDGEVKKKIRYILKSHPPKLSTEDKEAKKGLVVRRLVSSLNQGKEELREMGTPHKLLKQIDDLVDALSELQD